MQQGVEDLDDLVRLLRDARQFTDSVGWSADNFVRNCDGAATQLQQIAEAATGHSNGLHLFENALHDEKGAVRGARAFAHPLIDAHVGVHVNLEAELATARQAMDNLAKSAGYAARGHRSARRAAAKVTAWLGEIEQQLDEYIEAAEQIRGEDIPVAIERVAAVKAKMGKMLSSARGILGDALNLPKINNNRTAGGLLNDFEELAVKLMTAHEAAHDYGEALHDLVES